VVVSCRGLREVTRSIGIDQGKNADLGAGGFIFGDGVIVEGDFQWCVRHFGEKEGDVLREGEAIFVSGLDVYAVLGPGGEVEGGGAGGLEGDSILGHLNAEEAVVIRGSLRGRNQGEGVLVIGIFLLGGEDADGCVAGGILGESVVAEFNACWGFGNVGRGDGKDFIGAEAPEVCAPDPDGVGRLGFKV